MKQALANIMLGLLLSFNAFAADNSIYIDQSGSNATVTVNQDGYGNVVRGIQANGVSDNTVSAKVYGNGNGVTVNQVGISNTLSLGINTTTGGVTTLPDGTTVTAPTVNYSVTGNYGTAVINSNNAGVSGASVSNYINIQQTGNFANTNVNVLGANNAIKATTDGGDDNSFVSTIKGNNNSQNVSMTGGGSASNCF